MHPKACLKGLTVQQIVHLVESGSRSTSTLYGQIMASFRWLVFSTCAYAAIGTKDLCIMLESGSMSRITLDVSSCGSNFILLYPLYRIDEVNYLQTIKACSIVPS
jgi:hypothetical protein